MGSESGSFIQKLLLFLFCSVFWLCRNIALIYGIHLPKTILLRSNFCSSTVETNIGIAAPGREQTRSLWSWVKGDSGLLLLQGFSRPGLRTHPDNILSSWNTSVKVGWCMGAVNQEPKLVSERAENRFRWLAVPRLPKKGGATTECR